MTSNMTYYNKNRSELLDFIDSPPRFVLEIGCGAGDFGKLLKQKYGSFVVGIEIEPSIASMAKNKLDFVYDRSYEEILAQEGFNLKFDLIVLNDVIEHMQNPLNFLKLLKKVASSDGYCLCSIPNFLYVDNLYDIIVKKDFCYKESGILDKTHLRFFTKKSIVRLFDNAGYALKKVRPLNYNNSLKWRIFNAITLGYLMDYIVYQYVVIANSID